jgi:hypothetical protein
MVEVDRQAGAKAMSDPGRPSSRSVTVRMVDAGVYAAREFPLGGDLGELVCQVYLAMDAERQDDIDSASAMSAVK